MFSSELIVVAAVLFVNYAEILLVFATAYVVIAAEILAIFAAVVDVDEGAA